MDLKPSIFITRQIPADVLERLRSACEVEMWLEADIPVPRKVLEEQIAEVDGLFCLLTDLIDDSLLQRTRNLKIVSNMAVGYNNIDVDAASSRGIYVTNTPGVLTETTADLTFALLMATARRVVEASEFLRQGRWSSWSPYLLTGRDVYGAKLGIIGLGSIGEALARRAKGFNMEVVYYSRSRKTEVEDKLGLKYVSLETLLKQSDFVCVMTPLSKETHHLIGRKELAFMKPTAVLINTARGGVVDEQALYHALCDGTIWAAGLDVFEQEPVPVDHPLLSLPNVVALPHIGSASIHTRTLMAHMAADNILQALNGDIPHHLVNRPN